MENRRSTARSNRTHLHQGSEASRKENEGRSSRAAFGDITNHDSQRDVWSQPLVAKNENRDFPENTPKPRAALEPLHGLIKRKTSSSRLIKTSIALSTEANIESASPQQLWKDIDVEEGNNPMTCAHLANDIMAELFRAERTKRPNPSYMSSVQHDIAPAMRSILVDWLVEVAQEYKLHSDTLYQTVGMIDRYLSVARVPRNYLQLVGVSCMLVASKYEEIYCQTVEDFCFITENTYTRDEVLSMERSILGGLSFELTVPTVRAFLRRFVKAAAATFPGDQPDSRLEYLSSYLAELSLLEYDALRYHPSMIAASAVFLAQYCICRAPWNPTLQHYSSYMASDLRSCVNLLHRCYLRARTNDELPAVRDKYRQAKYECVADSDPPATLPAAIFFGHL